MRVQLPPPPLNKKIFFGKQVFPKRTKEKPMQQKDTCENTIVLQKVNVGIIQMLRLLK